MLQADCSSCFGLCCVALPFAASVDFAIDKEAGTPCPNLSEGFGCGIHARLREEGFRGCTVFDCFGAGQQVSQVTFGGRDWRQAPETARQMFDVFGVMRELHELLWHLTEAVELTRGLEQTQALDLDAARPVHEQLRRMLDDTEQLTRGSAEALLAVDVPRLRGEAAELLARTSELVRAGTAGPRQDHRRADLVGARLRDADLRGADLRGACLIAADLRRADLRLADLLGADLRDTDLRGADLGGALFLTQPQLTAARGDHRTVLPARLTRPAHW